MTKISLFDFQQEDVTKLLPKKSRLVASDPGTGKTYVGIALDVDNRLNREINVAGKYAKTLIICPKSVISVWDDHCMELTDQDVYVIDSKNRKQFVKDVMNKRQGGYFICHWEALRLMPELQKVQFFHIIADECHRAKNRKAQQTRALKKFKTTYKTGLSGTPADDKPQDLWSIVNWLWPNYYTSFWRFVKTYLIMETSDEGYQKVTGINERTLPRLHEEMRPWYVRRRKEDVLKDLPNKYYTRVWMDLDPKQRRAYDQMRKTMIAWVDSHKEEIEREDPLIAQAAVSQLVRLQQFACGYLIPKIDPLTGEQAFKWKWPKGTSKEHKAKYKSNPEKGGAVKKFLWDMTDPSTKLDTLMDLIEDRDGESIVVFSQFKTVINLLEKRLISKGISYGLLTGDVSQEDRAKAVSDFQDGKIRVFAGTIKAGGVGLTLTKASTVVFVDRSWSPAINLQAEDRLHRIGQKEAVEVIDLMARNTVDLGKHQKLSMKWSNIQKILGDTVTPTLVLEDLQKEEESAVQLIIKDLEED